MRPPQPEDEFWKYLVEETARTGDAETALRQLGFKERWWHRLYWMDWEGAFWRLTHPRRAGE